MKIKFATTVASTMIVIIAINGTVCSASTIEKAIVAPDFLVSQQPPSSPPTYGLPTPTRPKMPKKARRIIK